MIELTCWGCGWEGRVAERHAGLRVTCKRCRTRNTVPDHVTREVYTADWVAAVDRSSEAVTAEFDVRMLTFAAL